jgi:hypothetical protein
LEQIIEITDWIACQVIGTDFENVNGPIPTEIVEKQVEFEALNVGANEITAIDVDHAHADFLDVDENLHIDRILNLEVLLIA